MEVREVSIFRPEQVHSVQVDAQEQGIKQDEVGYEVAVVAVESSTRDVCVFVIDTDFSCRSVQIVTGSVVYFPHFTVLEG